MVANKRSNRGLCFLLLLIWGVGPQAAAGSESGDALDASRFAFELTTPSPRLMLQGDGSHEIDIKGFETHQRRFGAPEK